MPESDELWLRYKERVMTELERNHEDHKGITDTLHRIEIEFSEKMSELREDLVTRLNSVKQDVAILKTKAAMIGGAVGLVAGAVPAVIELLAK